METEEITARSVMQMVREKPLSLSVYANKNTRRRNETKAILDQLEKKKKVRIVTLDGQRVYVPFSWSLSNEAIYWQIMGRVKQVGECWEWQGFIDSRGSAIHQVSKEMNRPDVPKLLRVRRFLWEQKTKHKLGKNETIQPECLCDSCVNPDHMTKVDKNYKLEGRKLPYKRWIKTTKSAREKFGKINMDIAREIRLSEEPAKEIASRYQITAANVHMIRRGDTWREIGPSNNPFAGLVA